MGTEPNHTLGQWVLQGPLHMTLNSSWYNPERKVWASLHLDSPPVSTTLGSPPLTRSNKDSRVLLEIEVRSQMSSGGVIRSRRVRPMMTSIGSPPRAPRAVENRSFAISNPKLLAE